MWQGLSLLSLDLRPHERHGLIGTGLTSQWLDLSRSRAGVSFRRLIDVKNFCFVYRIQRFLVRYPQRMAQDAGYCKVNSRRFDRQKDTSAPVFTHLCEWRSNYSFWRPLNASVITSRFAYSRTLPAVIPRASLVISTGNSLRRLLI